MSLQRTLFLAGVGCLLAAMPLPAHHSFAEFDSNKPVTLQGKFTKMDWVNPHSWIHMEVVNAETKQTETWDIETGPPNTLYRNGWRTPWKIAYFFSKNLDPKYEALEFACWEGEVDLTKH